MSVYGLFQSSVLGMESNSHALAAIASNIANVRTGGHKRTDVHFATVLSRTVSSQPGTPDNAPSGTAHSDLGGVRPKDYARVSLQGQIEFTDRQLDAALNGRGFFVLNSALDGSGEQLYGRDGRFSVLSGPQTAATGIGGAGITVNEGYLVDKNGYYLQGWEPDASGNFPTGAASLTSLRVDPYAFSSVGQATAQATLALNLPATDAAGDVETFTAEVFDSAGNRQDLLLRFIKDGAANVWDVDIGGASGDVVTVVPSADFTYTTNAAQETVFDLAAGTIQVRGLGAGDPAAGSFTALAAGDTVTVAGSASNDGAYLVASVSGDGSTITLDPSTPLAANEFNAAPTGFLAAGVLAQPLTFGADGFLAAPGQYAVSVAHAGGTSSAFTLDVTGFTQFGGPFTPFTYTQDGFAASALRSIEFDGEGQVIGLFDSGMSRPLYKLALANFINPDGLLALNGNVYAESVDSGTVEIGVAGQNGLASLQPAAREMSNVELSQEFSTMIMTQTAYNASATSFRTIDEMTEVARDLKA